MQAFNSIVATLNDILWSTPLPVLCLGAGLLFTIVLRAPQIRHIKIMVKMLFGSQSSDQGLSSFQAFCLAIAGRVGTGNIAGVATGICFGGPGALFWMWMVAIFGAATTFVECSMSQLYKEKQCCLLYGKTFQLQNFRHRLRNYLYYRRSYDAELPSGQCLRTGS